ncbi:hypothetical protein [Streptomyces erythrochromogenes]|uniref:hypothetical protein n=1 Tax=Streptomyces erythrochromogenes TaxID=285574 RepID=UPI0022588D38|nr:hypothetical protein [Streptomyces erythrochromogenes]MCX5583987.1 hypothetical protein [Streptomyces erythrochromogenes]
MPNGSLPSPDATVTAVKPGHYPPPNYICEQLDFKEFSDVFQLQGARDGYNTGLEPERVSGSMCEQSISRGGTDLVKVSFHCSAGRDADTAIKEFDLNMKVLYEARETATGPGGQAFRYRNADSPTIGLKVRAGNLECQVEAEPSALLTEAEIDNSFTRMTRLLQTLIPKLGPLEAQP